MGQQALQKPVLAHKPGPAGSRQTLTPPRQYLLGLLIGSAPWLYFVTVYLIKPDSTYWPFVTLFAAFFVFLGISLVFLKMPRLYRIGYGILIPILWLPITLLVIIMIIIAFH